MLALLELAVVDFAPYFVALASAVGSWAGAAD